MLQSAFIYCFVYLGMANHKSLTIVKTAVAALLLFFSVNVIAQPVMQHQQTIGGNMDDNLKSMCFTSDGGIVLGGYSSSGRSGEKTKRSRGGDDYWVVKLDNKGVIEWDKTISGDADDVLNVILQTKDGGYILGGYSWSGKFAEKTDTGRGWSDFWVVKLDKQGNIQWDKTIGGNDMDFLSCMQQTQDGGYLLGGYSYSNRSGEKTDNSRGQDDYWIVKLDAGGKVQWNKTIGGKSYDYLFALQQTSDGGCILGGYSYSGISGEKTGASRGNADFWIVKINRQGTIQWDKTIGGNGEDELYALEPTTDNGYIAGGRSASGISGEKTAALRGATDYWVVKMDAAGGIQWDKTIGGTDYDYLQSLQQTKDSGYVLGGASWSNGSYEKSANRVGTLFRPDYWVVKLRADGSKVWDRTIGGDEHDALFCIKEISKDHYLAGGSSSSGISGTKTDSCRGGTDYWLVEIAETSAVAAMQTDNSSTGGSDARSFRVYPMPQVAQ